jgi:hypothetical protein
MRLDYLHLEGLSRDQGGQTSSGLPFRRWRKVCSQGCPPLRRNRTAARRPRCLVSGGQWPLSLPVDCLDRPGDAFLASPFCLWRRGVVLVRDETRTAAFSSPRHPPLPCPPCHPRAALSSRFCDAPRRLARIPGIQSTLHARRPRAAVSTSLAVCAGCGYPVARSEGSPLGRHYIPERAS